jgi:hypothetical protein
MGQDQQWNENIREVEEVERGWNQLQWRRKDRRGMDSALSSRSTISNGL